MIQDCYIEEIKDIVKEKKLHMSEQELYFAEREMQKNIIEYNMKIYAAALSAIERVHVRVNVISRKRVQLQLLIRKAKIYVIR